MTVLRIKMTPEEAEAVLRKLPGPRKFWLWLADVFVRNYQDEAKR